MLSEARLDINFNFVNLFIQKRHFSFAWKSKSISWFNMKKKFKLISTFFPHDCHGTHFGIIQFWSNIFQDELCLIHYKW